MPDYTVLRYAELAAQVYNDPPQFGLSTGPALAKMYGGTLVFRGTDNWAYVAADVDAVATPVEKIGSVHAGFWHALSGILPALLAAPMPSVVVGHSAGAALASLYAGVMTAIGKPPVAVYGFEPPRMCADDTLLSLLKSAGVMRWYCRNGSDPVPLVPSWMTIPGPLTQIGKAGIVPDIDDHLIENVVKALKA